MQYESIRIGENVWEQVPITDTEGHLLGDECWCAPKIHYGPNMMCHDGFARATTIIEHNPRIEEIKVLADRLAPPKASDIIRGSTNNKQGDNNNG